MGVISSARICEHNGSAMRWVVAVFMTLLALWMASPVYAAGDEASAYVQNVGDQALAVISNKALSKDQKQAGLEKIFGDNVDFPWIGRFVMGRYWREATPDQKTRYVAEYQKFEILHYTSRFTNYTGGSVKVTSDKDDGNGEYTVSMQMQSDDANSEPVLVDYRVRKNTNKPGFKIFDVIVEGVSLLTTQRSEFTAVLNDKGIDYLIDQLAKKPPEDDASVGKN